MKKQKVFTEKAVNAKIIFRGVVVEIKKVSDQEVELTFPENVDTKELLSYLENFGVLKRKVAIPHLETQPEVKIEESAPVQQEEQVKEDEEQVKENNVENYEEDAKKEDTTEPNAQSEEPSQAEDSATAPRRRKRKS